MGRSVGGIREAATLFEVAYDRDVKYPAAALAYYAYVSLVPLLMLSFAVFGHRLTGRLEEAMTLYITPSARELYLEAIVSVSGRTGGVLLSVVVLLWTGGNVVVGFQTVVERIEGTAGEPNAGRLLSGVVILGSLTMAGVAIVAASLLAARTLDGIVVDTTVAAITLLVLLTAVFLPVYYVPSRVVASPVGALPGAFVAAAGWTVLHLVVRLYVAFAPRYAVYGTLSGVIILLTSLYVAAILLTFGVVVNWSRATDAPVRTV